MRREEANEESQTGELTVGEVNRLDREEFVARFGGLYENSPWVAEEAWEARPFESVEDLRRAFEACMYGAPQEKQTRARPGAPGPGGEGRGGRRAYGRIRAGAGFGRARPFVAGGVQRVYAGKPRVPREVRHAHDLLRARAH